MKRPITDFIETLMVATVRMKQTSCIYIYLKKYSHLKNLHTGDINKLTDSTDFLIVKKVQHVNMLMR